MRELLSRSLCRRPPVGAVHCPPSDVDVLVAVAVNEPRRAASCLGQRARRRTDDRAVHDDVDGTCSRPDYEEGWVDEWPLDGEADEVSDEGLPDPSAIDPRGG
jgi:hypothetical protein